LSSSVSRGSPPTVRRPRQSRTWRPQSGRSAPTHQQSFHKGRIHESQDRALCARTPRRHDRFDAARACSRQRAARDLRGLADQPTIHSDRWFGSSDLGHERLRTVKEDKFVMRFRREGGTDFDAGSTGNFRNRLLFANPAVAAAEAEFMVRDLVVTGCPANPTASSSRVRIELLKFSDLNPAVIRPPGDRTGDYVGRVYAFRTSDSTDPDGLLTVGAILFRCNNGPCSASTTIAGPIALGQVALKKWFRMRLAWDAPASQSRAGLNSDPEVMLPYNPLANSRPGNGPYALLGIQHLPANCTMTSGGPTVGDAEITVRKVWTNASAVIP
jgi:hypothetical protein